MNVNMTCAWKGYVNVNMTCAWLAVLLTADVAVLLGCVSASRVEMSVSWPLDTETSTIPLRKRRKSHNTLSAVMNVPAQNFENLYI